MTHAAHHHRPKRPHYRLRPRLYNGDDNNSNNNNNNHDDIDDDGRRVAWRSLRTVRKRLNGAAALCTERRRRRRQRWARCVSDPSSAARAGFSEVRSSFLLSRRFYPGFGFFFVFISLPRRRVVIFHCPPRDPSPLVTTVFFVVLFRHAMPAVHDVRAIVYYRNTIRVTIPTPCGASFSFRKRQ